MVDRSLKQIKRLFPVIGERKLCPRRPRRIYGAHEVLGDDVGLKRT